MAAAIGSTGPLIATRDASVSRWSLTVPACAARSRPGSTRVSATCRRAE